jgi:hypothetical protein
MDRLKLIFNHYGYSTENFEDKINKRKTLLTQGKSIFECHIKTSLNPKNSTLKDLHKLDTLYHSYYAKMKPIYNIKEEIIPYNNRYKEREELIKENKKTPYEIEEYLCKKYNIDIELEHLKEIIELHHDIIRVFSNKRGRPPLPSYLKKEGIEKNREKMREKMRNTYDFIKEINNNLLTDEEFDFLKEKTEGNTSLINKLLFFTSDKYNSNLN